MADSNQENDGAAQPPSPNHSTEDSNVPRRPACPVCGGRLIEIHGKLECSVCHTICETCCEGGPE